MPTGSVEVAARAVTVLNQSKTPPFYIDREAGEAEALRLKYRYLDLRRERMQRNMASCAIASSSSYAIFWMREGFIEIETPILTKSTPEGARDYLVPSRVHPGSFYALPQSPQQLKQLLMVAGFERYFQIARCFRDEDLRGDRQPEFTQLDLEMSFVEREDVMQLIEEMYTRLVEEVSDKKLLFKPFPRLTYREAIERFGKDNPDLRFGMELVDDRRPGSRRVALACSAGPSPAGGRSRASAPRGLASYSRKQIDELADFVQDTRGQGLGLAGGRRRRCAFLLCQVPG